MLAVRTISPFYHVYWLNFAGQALFANIELICSTQYWRINWKACDKYWITLHNLWKKDPLFFFTFFFFFFPLLLSKPHQTFFNYYYYYYYCCFLLGRCLATGQNPKHWVVNSKNCRCSYSQLINQQKKKTWFCLYLGENR